MSFLIQAWKVFINLNEAIITYTLPTEYVNELSVICHCCFFMFLIVRLMSLRCICHPSSTAIPTVHTDLSNAATEKYWTAKKMWEKKKQVKPESHCSISVQQRVRVTSLRRGYTEKDEFVPLDDFIQTSTVEHNGVMSWLHYQGREIH